MFYDEKKLSLDGLFIILNLRTCIALFKEIPKKLFHRFGCIQTIWKFLIFPIP